MFVLFLPGWYFKFLLLDLEKHKYLYTPLHSCEELIGLFYVDNMIFVKCMIYTKILSFDMVDNRFYI